MGGFSGRIEGEFCGGVDKHCYIDFLAESSGIWYMEFRSLFSC